MVEHTQQTTETSAQGQPPTMHRAIDLSDNARTVLTKRYLRRGPDGKPAETIEEMFWRVAWHVAEPETEYGADRQAAAERYYDLLTSKRFFPNSPTFTGAGTPLGQLAACFVLKISDDMGRNENGIFQTLRDAALIQQTGGGNGFAFSSLRPKGARVKTSEGEATGPVGFLRVYDQAFGEIAQGGSRRGANMGVLRVNHPDIREFITCKINESHITNFNISVGVTDDFMQAVKDDRMFDLINPQNGEVWEKVHARELFDMMVKQAHHNGEPGILFLDAANRDNPVPHLYQIESTNPCVTGDTLVATPGGWRRADQIQPGDVITTVLGTGEVASVEVHDAMPVFAVQFSDGGTVMATAAHRFYACKPGDKDFTSIRLDQLEEGMWVRVEAVSVPKPVLAGVEDAGESHAPFNNRLMLVGGSMWAARIDRIEPAGIETVYDIYEPTSDTWITEGYVSQGCGEQFLGPFENCCLGSINLAQHFGPDGSVDWAKLRESVELSTRFLDDVVDANKYVPAVPQLEVAAKRVRRIGLGIMGLADLMYHAGVRYGSKEGQEFASQVMEFVHFHAMRTSVELAKDRGSFLAIRGSLYDPTDLKWQMPQPLVAHVTDWDRPACDWNTIREGILAHGIRNGACTTVAPTGTISTVAGCEGYGCEPVFALAYMRHFNDNGKDTILQYTSPAFEKALVDAGLDEAARTRIVDHVNHTGTCQDVAELPEKLRHAFVVASDISAEEHVRMQASMQRFCSNAISKTCNFPSTATPEDVAKAYMLAWELGCKGLTVYVAGSRDKVVLETAETAKARTKETSGGTNGHSNGHAESMTMPAPAEVKKSDSLVKHDAEPLPLFKNEVKKPRSRMLKGYTYRVETPLGTTFVTINQNGGDKPFEVFIHTSKAGSETAAVSEALGRLISYILRMNSNVDPNLRLKEVVRQLEGIGGGRSLGLGPKRVRSLPDGVAQVLNEYLAQVDESLGGMVMDEIPTDDIAAEPPAPGQMPLPMLKGDLCPECGEAAVINEEGCRKCYACGFSEC
jgi:ribonucleotide reductase alpha subunit